MSGSRELACSGRVLAAREAIKIGLADRLAESGGLMDEVRDFAAQ